ncbi:transposase [Sphingomonas sp.]|uniref:transposase n=1 Tax=Sphingomonas sp. TaxID=28214 RepID=UPI003AFFA9EA
MAWHLFWVSDGAWAAIEPHLPHGCLRKPRVDDRTVISGILHVPKTGCRWREGPAAHGPPTTTAITVGVARNLAARRELDRARMERNILRNAL